MNYEEKYKEAFKRAEAIIRYYKNLNRGDETSIKDLELIFPELKESEDEKVRKELLEHCKNQAKSYIQTGNKCPQIQSWIAWLEKQGQKDILEDAILDGNEDGLIADTIRYKHEKQSKQKLDKVEPKFKVGDWIINPRTGLIKHIKNVLLCDNNGNYEFESSSMSIDSVDNSFHLWTIQDAKDGDVLWHSDTASHGTFIFKQIRYDGKVLCYCDYDSEDHFCTGEHHTCCWSSDKYIKPATKEQRDLLFSKMNEAGYEWDFKKKELKKIEDEHQLKEGKFYECIKSYHYLGGGQYWFEKGSVYFCEKDGYLRLDSNNNIYVYDCKNWQSYFRPYAEKLAWSEEDDQYVEDIIALIQRGLSCHTIGQVQEWLQSLKGRVQPQNTWKPSETDITILEKVFNGKIDPKDFQVTLFNVLEQLNKLKEE